jgi:AcrR family transcriptional regulator
MTEHWLIGDQAELAAERILDAAGRCFASRGVFRASIGEIAREAGCSRPTIYRYFSDRDALRTAYMHREARRLSHSVGGAIKGVQDPGRRLVDAVLIALQGVRANPALVAWFTEQDGASTTGLAGSSPVIASLTEALLGDAAEPDRAERARWLVRIMLSLLLLPGRNEKDERAMLERFVVPVVSATTSSGAQRKV